MTRHALALPLLLTILLCVVLPAPALAQPGKGHGKSQRDDSSYQQSRDDRSDYGDQRGNGKGRSKHSDRGNSRQKHQSSDENYDYGRNRSENSGRGNSSQKYRTSEDNYNSSRRGQQNSSMSAQGAAQRARSQYGGQVLKVQPSNNGYQVRLLKDDGRVVTVPIAD
jgi:hypothetical protein